MNEMMRLLLTSPELGLAIGVGGAILGTNMKNVKEPLRTAWIVLPVAGALLGPIPPSMVLGVTYHNYRSE